ncbi:MAG: UDP-N-acetylglucosamine--N-acetylmuramyl-(pentapeptide) pyrophosphoryl-undecaprenol N-acetylglucosamine transferase [Treponema sp.]|nr:UDP-N-acetylglucosamine--N-acetylmuramyl-(pentapeptide) pyrophosphoryl-undecaprenol N-acetylglucosamine transferase [Treponema sp.]
MEPVVTVVCTGGGTGGHIYPGLAVADAFRARARDAGVAVRIVWIGAAVGMDRAIVEKNSTAAGSLGADIFYGIPAGKLRRYLSFKNVTDIFRIAAGFFASFFLLKKLKPAVLFSKGGFVSVPPCAAARVLKIPVYTHECDLTPGLATRLNSRSAARILVSYGETVPLLPRGVRDRALVTGNPVRAVFHTASATRGYAFLGITRSDKPVLAVLGGSSGAQQINTLIWEQLPWLTEHFFVVHQTGPHATSIPDRPGYSHHAFIHAELSDVIAASDVVLSRAGANSLWECATLGKPLVLVPLAGSGTRGDQIDNARYFSDRGAAVVLAPGDVDGEHLRRSLTRLLDAAERARYGAAGAALVRGSAAADTIAGLLFDAAIHRQNEVAV